MLVSVLALVIAAWGMFTPTTIYYAPIDNLAYAGQSDSQCIITVHPEIPSHRLYSIILHEYGHCLGLGHFGDCNTYRTIMGCADLGYVDEYSKFRVEVAHMPYRLIVPWSYD